MDWARILAYITGTVDQELLLRNEYLAAENRILKAQIKTRLRLTDAERVTLAEIAHRLGRKALEDVANVVKPDTLMVWYRRLVARKFDGSKSRRYPGRPRIDSEIEQFVVRMAKENTDWGYDRIVGAMANLGYRLSDQTVGNILQRHGIPPAPERQRKTTWADFIRVHLSVLAGTDFFSVEVLTLRGLVTYYVLFFIHLESRRVEIAGITPVLSTWRQIADNTPMNSLPNYRGYRFPSEIISHTVWLYHRFTLSLRDIEDLLAERNVIVSYESIRQWCNRFGLDYAKRLRKRRGPGGDRWFLDEVTVSIQGRRQYLWRAVDQDGDVLDILLQSRKDKRAAKRFFRKLLKDQERTPIELMTDKLRSYGAAKREMMPSVVHCQDKYANNRAEVSHEHTREQERQMQGFASSGQAKRFLSVHGQVHNLFRVGRHLLRAVNYRVLRGRAFATWQEVTCAQ